MLRHHSHALDTNRVIVLTDPMPPDVAVGAARRAGATDPPVVPWGGVDEVRSAASAGSLVIVTCGPEDVPDAVRALFEAGAPPIPALAVEGGADAPRLTPSARSLLADPRLRDLEVPVPAVRSDDVRRVLWDQLRALSAEERHHLLEVDGGPAKGWLAISAAAAGVLAGRRVAGDRRWRAGPA
jgi:hypothetical protein